MHACRGVGKGGPQGLDDPPPPPPPGKNPSCAPGPALPGEKSVEKQWKISDKTVASGSVAPVYIQWRFQ